MEAVDERTLHGDIGEKGKWSAEMGGQIHKPGTQDKMLDDETFGALLLSLESQYS